MKNGFTQIEIIVTLLIISILSVVAIPSYLSLKQTQDFNNNLSNLTSALKELSTNTRKNGRRCPFNFTTSSLNLTYTEVIDGVNVPTGCQLSNPFNLLSGYTISHTFPSGSFYFTYKGTFVPPPSSTDGDLIILSSPHTTQKKCIAITILGVIRSGDFNSSTNTCNSSF